MQTKTVQSSPVSTTDGICSELRDIQRNHPLSNNPLLVACREGTLTLEDFRFVFSQYYA